ncbi:MAG: alpha/beta fold hydrolase [Pseudonocardiaceae bacterium]
MLTTYSAGRLFAERFGTGPPTVIALHGWGRNRQDFTATLAGLDALAVDLPGFGLSPAPGEIWGTMEYAEHLIPVLDECPHPPIVVGHSFGGRVALRLGAHFPDRVSGLVLTGVPLLRRKSARPAPPLPVRLGRALRRWNLVSDGLLNRVRNRYGSTDYRAAEGVMRSIMVRVVNEDYEQDLRKLRCPVQMVWGSADAEASPEMAQTAAEIISRADLMILPEIGHLLPISAPEHLRAAIDKLESPGNT